MIAARFAFVPLAALLLGAAAPVLRPTADAGVTGDMSAPLDRAVSAPAAQDGPWAQVRILQHLMVRITPGPPMPPPIELEIEQQDPARRDVHKLGKCLAVGQIAAVQAARDNHLLLFMRDQRIVSAVLEKACKASEFYSGFYMARNADGQLCLGRDTLQSRSGAACKVKRWKELAGAD